MSGNIRHALVHEIGACVRIFHTSDWHVGRSLYGTSLLSDQAELLAELVRIAADEQPDVVLIAGDIYDRAVPSHAAVDLLDETLHNLVIKNGLPCILIAGNHDSGERLAFSSRLLARESLHVIGRPSSSPKPIVLSDTHGPVYFFGLPYASPGEVREAMGNDSINDHQTAMTSAMNSVRAASPHGARSVVLAHTFVTGAKASESERPLVGGLASVERRTFDGVSYAALGHLHRPQTIHDERIRYAGSLMRYAFSEADQDKSVSMVEIDLAGEVTVREIPLTAKRDLRCLSGSLQQVLGAAALDPRYLDYLEITLTDTKPVFDAMRRLREHYPNVLHIRRAETELDTTSTVRRDLSRMDDRELLNDFYQHVVGLPLSSAQRSLYDEHAVDLRSKWSSGDDP